MLRGAGRDLHQPDPLPTAACGFGLKMALIARDARDQRRPERRALMLAGARIGGAEGFDIARNFGGEPAAMALHGGDRRKTPPRRPAPPVPAQLRNPRALPRPRQRSRRDQQRLALRLGQEPRLSCDLRTHICSHRLQGEQALGR